MNILTSRVLAAAVASLFLLGFTAAPVSAASTTHHKSTHRSTTSHSKKKAHKSTHAHKSAHTHKTAQH